MSVMVGRVRAHDQYGPCTQDGSSRSRWRRKSFCSGLDCTLLFGAPTFNVKVITKWQCIEDIWYDVDFAVPLVPYFAHSLMPPPKVLLPLALPAGSPFLRHTRRDARMGSSNPVLRNRVTAGEAGSRDGRNGGGGRR